MKKIINILGIIVCLYCATLILSCSKGHDLRPVKIGLNEWPGYDPFILADKSDFFEKNDVNVEVIRFSSATEVIKAMKDMEISAACLTLDEVFSLIESGFPCKVVLVLDYSMGGDMIVGQKDVKSFSELEAS